MPTQDLSLSCEDEPLSARHARPETDRGEQVLLLAHGAGLGMNSEFMDTIAGGLCAAGYPVLRFNYPYAERMEADGTRRPPDRRPRLEAAHQAALRRLVELYPKRPIVLAGKSMGARMSSLMAADGTPCTALVFLGYPLHPPGREDRLRSEHFPQIRQPALFLQGTRDALCKLELLRPELERFAGPPTLSVVDDADHDFQVPKRAGATREEVLAGLVELTAAWLADLPRT